MGNPIAILGLVLVVVAALMCANCNSDITKVEVAKYREYGPATTTHPDGSATATTGGREFKLLNVERKGENPPP